MNLGQENTRFIEAARDGDVELLQSLIPLTPIEDRNRALMWAAEEGALRCVNTLIPVSNPKANNSFALVAAARKGFAACVQRLIPVSNPKDRDSHALMMAAQNGNTECVELLIPVSDPKANHSIALFVASRNRHRHCIDLLIEVCDAELVLQRLMDAYPNTPKYWEYLQDKVCIKQRDRLIEHTLEHGRSNFSRKM